MSARLSEAPADPQPGCNEAVPNRGGALLREPVQSLVRDYLPGILRGDRADALARARILEKSIPEDIRREIGCDWLVYQDLDALERAVMDGNPGLAGGEGSCFSGKYITDGVTADYLQQIELIRQDAVKV